jgi:type I restriction enzyme, S subunit
MEVKAGYKQTEIGVIPEDWVPLQIQDVCRLVNGRGFKPHEWKTSGLPIIRIQNINGSEDFNFYPGQFNPKILVEPGQLLFAWSGSRGTSFGPHVWNGGRALLNYHTWKVMANESCVFPEFLLYALRQLTGYIEDRAHGASALVHTQKWEMEKFPIVLPSSLTEQRAIAAALSDVDALLDGIDQLIAKKRDLKQATMQQLLTGETRLPGFESEWEVKTLGEEANFYKGKGLPKSALNPYGSEPCVHYGELFTQYSEKITETINRTADTPDYFRSVSNDVLMPTSDVTPKGLAKASCVMSDGVVLGGDILVIRTSPLRICGVFLSHIIRKEETQVLRLVTGTTVFHLYSTDMAKFIFSLPSINEQKAIVAVLSDMDAQINALKQRRAKTASLKQAMMQELLTGKTRLVKAGALYV